MPHLLSIFPTESGWRTANALQSVLTEGVMMHFLSFNRTSQLIESLRARPLVTTFSFR